jgi:hypothetical protein
VLRRGQPVAAGISAIHEGTQVRASFDPASNRADKIEVMGRATRSKRSKSGKSSMKSGSTSDTSSSNTGAGTDQTNSKSNTGSGDSTNTPK